MPGAAHERSRAMMPRARSTVQVGWPSWSSTTSMVGRSRSRRMIVRTIIRLERERPTIDVVDDQLGQPTWTVDLARGIIALDRSCAAPGIYHASSAGSVTWFGLASEIFTLLGADPARVKPITTAEYPSPASRPACSVLGHDAWSTAQIAPLPPWQLALRRAFPDLLAAQADQDPATAARPH